MGEALNRKYFIVYRSHQRKIQGILESNAFVVYCYARLNTHDAEYLSNLIAVGIPRARRRISPARSSSLWSTGGSTTAWHEVDNFLVERTGVAANKRNSLHRQDRWAYRIYSSERSLFSRLSWRCGEGNRPVTLQCFLIMIFVLPGIRDYLRSIYHMEMQEQLDRLRVKQGARGF